MTGAFRKIDWPEHEADKYRWLRAFSSLWNMRFPHFSKVLGWFLVIRNVPSHIYLMVSI